MTELKFKNRVSLVGTISELDVEFREFETKSGPNKGDMYNAATGSITLDTGGDNLVNLRIFQKEKFGNGNDNPNYKQYKDWDDRLKNGEDLSEVKVGMATSIGATVAQDGSLVEAANIQAGFLDRKTPAGNGRAEFATEVILEPGCIRPEIKDDVETGRGVLTGNLVDFQGKVYPARFIVENQDGISYLEDLSSKGVTVLEIWGKVINTSEVTKQTIEAAFGAPREVETVRTRRENVISGAAMEPREMTQEIADAITEGRKAFEVYKTSVQERNSGGSAPAPAAKKEATPAAPAKSGFNF